MKPERLQELKRLCDFGTDENPIDGGWVRDILVALPELLAEVERLQAIIDDKDTVNCDTCRHDCKESCPTSCLQTAPIVLMTKWEPKDE